MAAKALAPFEVTETMFWNRFQQFAADRVRECNAIAGEPLWITAMSSAPQPVFTVQSVESADNRVECSFDFEQRMLTCRPGPAISADPLVFRWVRGTVDTLRCGGSCVTLEQALGQILDELMWTDPAELCEEEETGQ